MSLELHPLTVGLVKADECSSPPPSFRRRALLSIFGALAVTGVLGFVLARRGGQFTTALHTAPIALLLLAVLLQIVALLARSEAWNVCVRAAGGTVARRLLFRAAGVGYLASLVNGSVGMAVRIASLRRVAPEDRSSCAGAARSRGSDHYRRSRTCGDLLLHADRSARRSLVGARDRSRGITGCVVAAVRRVSERHRAGLWAGLAVVRNRGSRSRDRVHDLGRVRPGRAQLADASRDRRKRLGL